MITTEDRLDIAELLVRYCIAFDDGDEKRFASCFTEDGILDGRNGVHEGRAALEAFAASAVSRGVYRHVVTNILIEPEKPDVAAVRSYLMYYLVDESGINLQTSARNTDRIVKLQGQWFINKRTVVADQLLVEGLA